MAYFTDSMTSEEARKTFFDFVEKMRNDEISLEEFGEIITEYKNVSEEITDREMKEWLNEINGYTIRISEDAL